jgi:hypothetical protein
MFIVLAKEASGAVRWAEWLVTARSCNLTFVQCHHVKGCNKKIRGQNANSAG